MEYVMVPVPEEHVAEVAQYLQWSTAKLPSDVWDPDAISSFLQGLDQQARLLLLRAAECAEEVTVLTIPDAAEAAGCSEREILGLMMELNARIGAAGGPPFALATAVIDGTTEIGPRAWTLNMPGAVAELFLDAAVRAKVSPL
jgi:hypothetical protein